MEVLEVDGRRLAYWDAGRGPNLVFIHGVGTSGELWAGDLADLAADFRVITYDRRGYGESSGSPRDWRAHRADAIALIDALDAAPAVIVGFSGGGMVALDLALNRPDLIGHLVLLDPAFNIKRCITPGFVRAMVMTKLVRRRRGDRAAAANWLRYVSSYPTGGSGFDKASPERRENLLANASGIFADLESGSGDHVPEDRLVGVEVPTTLIDCRLSPPFLRKSCDRLRALMPQASAVTLERSGHHVGLDARDELATLLRAVVAQGDPPAYPLTGCGTRP